MVFQLPSPVAGSGAEDSRPSSRCQPSCGLSEQVLEDASPVRASLAAALRLGDNCRCWASPLCECQSSHAVTCQRCLHISDLRSIHMWGLKKKPISHFRNPCSTVATTQSCLFLFQTSWMLKRQQHRFQRRVDVDSECSVKANALSLHLNACPQPSQPPEGTSDFSGWN